jgi:DNA polymerase-3 subunit chi
MTDILFYHLQNQPLERALPALLERCLDRGWRAIVETGSDERCAAIDGILWTYREDSFLPHGTLADGAPETQPVLVLAGPANPNAATVRFLVDRAAPPADPAQYERLVVMFDGNDEEALADARAQWKALKTGGHEMSYWQQDGSGRWVKKA